VPGGPEPGGAVAERRARERSQGEQTCEATPAMGFAAGGQRRWGRLSHGPERQSWADEKGRPRIGALIRDAARRAEVRHRARSIGSASRASRLLSTPDPTITHTRV
jgi:hypothetical protein